jgi:hypothetical protein
MPNEKKEDRVARHKKEAVDFVKKFYQASWNWRSQGFHAKWDRWERNYNNIYDPQIKAKKAYWQTTMFDPLTVTNVEVIAAALTKLNIGKKRVMALEPREMGDELQAELHTKMLDYEVEKSEFPLNYYDVQKEGVIFGNGFMKFYYEKKYAPRRIKKPRYESIVSALKNFRKPIVEGFDEEVKTTLVRDNIKCEKIHIRDIFLEPNSLEMSRVLHREKISYGEMKRLADEGLMDKESVQKLWTVHEPDNFEVDMQVIMNDLDIQDATDVPRPDYAQKHTVWELWDNFPRKWIDLEMSDDTEAEKGLADELVPGKILVASGGWFLASAMNEMPDMEPPFLKLPYIRSGRTYDIGVPQLLEGIQEESNEIRNLRVDNVNLVLNKIFVVLEKYVTNSQDLKSQPGGIIRIKGSQVDDVRKAVSELPISDVAISAFRETGELERKAQEVTAANRVTVGSAGLSKDANQTLGGMELLRQAAFDRFTVYAWVIGKAFITKAAKKIMALSYQNSSPERIRRILGISPLEILPGQWVQKWQAYKMLPIHELDMDYDFVPVDIFGMENKAQKRQSLASDMQLTASIVPQFDPRPGLRRLFMLDEIPKEEIDEILKGIEGPSPTPLGMGQGVPSLAKPVKTQTGDVPPAAAPVGSTPGL